MASAGMASAGFDPNRLNSAGLAEPNRLLCGNPVLRGAAVAGLNVKPDDAVEASCVAAGWAPNVKAGLGAAGWGRAN